MSTLSDYVFLGTLDVIINLIQVFSYLCKSSIFGNLELNRDFHVDLRVNTHPNFPFYLDNSSSS